MLDAWIIEQIRRREEQREQERRQERIEVPLEQPRYHDSDPAAPPKDEPKRGVVVIDL